MPYKYIYYTFRTVIGLLNVPNTFIRVHTNRVELVYLHKFICGVPLSVLTRPEYHISPGIFDAVSKRT